VDAEFCEFVLFQHAGFKKTHIHGTNSLKLVHINPENGVKITKEFSREYKMRISFESSSGQNSDFEYILNGERLWLLRSGKSVQDIKDVAVVEYFRGLYQLQMNPEKFLSGKMESWSYFSGADTNDVVLNFGKNGYADAFCGVKSCKLRFDKKNQNLMCIEYDFYDSPAMKCCEMFENYEEIKGLYLPKKTVFHLNHSSYVLDLLSAEVNPAFKEAEFLPDLQTGREIE